MKYIPFLFACLTLSCISNEERNALSNSFPTYQDTFLLKTDKREGVGLFQFGAGIANFKDTSSTFPHEIKFPSNLTDVRRMIIPNSTQNKSHNLDVILGYANGKETFVVDENNNRNLADDPQRLLDQISWYDNEGSIRVEYNFIDALGEERVDSSWIKLGLFRGDLRYARNQNLLADFNVGEDVYQVQIQDIAMSGTFSYSTYHSEIALCKKNEVTKDTLFEADILKIGEFLNLNDHYYRFDSITEFGEYVTLVREDIFEDKVGTQVGMNAPAFQFVSMQGDTISSQIFKNKMLLIANSCGCGGDTTSTQAFFDIKQRYNKELEMIRLDTKMRPGLEGFNIDISNTYNKDIYKKYRDAYCSRIYLVVGADGRIINKFSGSDWETVLPDILKLNRE